MRQRETIQNLPKGAIALTDVEKFIIDHQLIQYSRKNLLMATKRRIASLLPLINAKHIKSRKLVDSDLVYSWGAIITNNKPYVIELDNPTSLTFYNWGAIKNPVTKHIIKNRLMENRCRKIICISEACKEGVGKIFGKTALAKCEVVYPFAKPDFTKKRKQNEVRLLFISTQFYLKGGKELLIAFEKIGKKFPNARLTVISNTPKEIIEKYREMPGITFMEANVSKERLLSEIYPSCDIFVLPTYKDSFGLVLLEALSRGLPIVATDLYAIPEMVKHGKNGFLIEPPIRYFEKNNLPSDRFWDEDIGKYAKEHEFPKVVERLEEYLGKLIGDEQLRKSMADASKEIFLERFSEKTRMEKMEKILGEAAEG